MEDYIKVVLKEEHVSVCTRFKWLSIGSSGMLLWTQ